MNMHDPRWAFLKKRCAALHKSGFNNAQIARMLQIHPHTVRAWTVPGITERRTVARRLREAERVAQVRRQNSDIPTLAFVPGIIVTGRYQMVRAT